MRWVSAAGFAVLMGLALHVVPEAWTEQHETVWMLGLLVVYFAAGALVDRWWVLALAFLPVVLAVPLGVQGDADGTPTWWWVLVDTVAIFLWVTLAGLLTRRLARAARTSRTAGIGQLPSG